MARGFSAIWSTQLVSVIGSSATAFVLGVWVYQTTGSVSQYSIIFAVTVLPAVLVAPFAGALVDRQDRKWLLVGSDCGSAAATALVGVLWWAGGLQVWHVYLAAAVSASLGVVHSTAFYAMVPGLVAKKNLGRANGLIQLGRSVQVAAPLVAGAMLLWVDLGGVIVLDLTTFAVAMAAVLAIPLPEAVRHPARGAARGSFRADLGHGVRMIARMPGLPWLIAFAAAYYLVFALAAVLIRPLILAFTTASVLGVLEFLGGLGMVAGSLAMSAWGGPRKRIAGVLRCTALGGVALALHSLAPSPWLIAVVAPAFLCTMPVVSGTMMTLLHLKIPSGSLGRVMATFGMLSSAAMPIGALLAGPLADGVFEPLLRPGGTLAGSVGAVIGVGDGRGTALIFGLLGVALILLAALGRGLRGLEERLPDAVPDEPVPVAS